MAEPKKTTVKKTTTKKATPVKKKTTSSASKTKASPSTKKATPKKSTSTKTSATKKPSSTKKSAVKEPTIMNRKQPARPKTTKKKVAVQKEVLKKDVVVKKTTTKKKTRKKPKAAPTKTSKQVKAAVVTKAAIEEVFEGKQQVEKKPLGKLFYLIFTIVFYTAAYFYINNVVYDNEEHIQSALFAFAALFVVFVLLNFNIHRIVINFFRLPLNYLLTEARSEIHHDIIVDPDKKGFSAKFLKYKAIFTLSLYVVVLLVLMGSQIWSGILDDDKALVIVTQSLTTGLIFIGIVCSWQYLFNIIPGVLENSIDAKNGYILTLSAVVMIIYVVFIIFDISYLAEMMIFILILGFIALLGVNLNMIVGEFNIFKNLRNRSGQNKTVTRAVFLIFFSFHLYIILYASVVAYSIYNQNPDSYNFVNYDYKETIVEDVLRFGTPVTDVYDSDGEVITHVYDKDGNMIRNYIGTNGKYITEYYDSDGEEIKDFYMAPGDFNPISEVEFENVYYYSPSSNVNHDTFIFYEGSLVGIDKEELPHTYGDMLYYAIITISSIGYGDITPNSNYTLPQFWGAFLSIYGITFYALSIGYVSNIAGMGVAERKED